MPTSRIRSYPLISHGGIRGRIILGALGPLVCRNWRIRRRSLIYTMRFPTAVRQIAIGRYISSSKDMVAGVPFISTKSILGAAVGGNSSLGGENLRGVRTCAVSFEFAKSWGADIRRDCAAQYPMLRKITRPLGMSTTCKVTCCPRPMLLPQLQSTGLVLRELPCFVPQRCCNMWRLGATRGVSHFAPLGQFASRAGMGARARASNSDRNRSGAIAGPERDFGALMYRRRMSELRFRRGAGRISHAPPGSEALHRVTDRCLPSSRLRRAQGCHPLFPRAIRILSRARPEAPVMLVRNLD